MASGAAKYDRAKQRMVAGYARGQQYATQNWVNGESQFLGRAPRPERVQAYQEGYDPNAYASAINSTSGAKWAQGIQDKM